jgi:hypothetical protein
MGICVSDYRDKLRAGTIGRQNSLADGDVVPVKIEVEGEDLVFEIHKPSLKTRNQILRSAGVLESDDRSDSALLVPVYAAIYLTHTPRAEGEPVRVFTEADVSEFLEAKIGSYADLLMQAALKVVNDEPLAKAGN